MELSKIRDGTGQKDFWVPGPGLSTGIAGFFEKKGGEEFFQKILRGKGTFLERKRGGEGIFFERKKGGGANFILKPSPYRDLLQDN